MVMLRLAETAESAEVRGQQQAMVHRGQLDKESIQGELDDIMAVLAKNDGMEPDQAMLMCSGYIARLTEMYVQVQRIEHIRRELKSVRTQEIATILEAVRDIYKIHSRLITVRAMDQELSR